MFLNEVTLDFLSHLFDFSVASFWYLFDFSLKLFQQRLIWNRILMKDWILYWFLFDHWLASLFCLKIELLIHSIETLFEKLNFFFMRSCSFLVFFEPFLDLVDLNNQEPGEIQAFLNLGFVTFFAESFFNIKRILCFSSLHILDLMFNTF